MNRDVAWSAVEAGGSAFLSIGTAFFIARVIGPQELGFAAAAISVHVLLWVAVNAFFADAIVQRATLEEGVLTSAVWASVATGCAAAGVQVLAGGVLAEVLDDRRQLPMACLLALTLPLVGIGGPLQGLLTRQRCYRALAARTLIGQSAGAAAGLLLASRAGAWASVVQQTIVSAGAPLVLLAAAGWRPRFALHWGAIRQLARFGLPLTASALVQIGRYRVFALLIGAILGPAALGQIHIAFRLADTMREIMFTALWRLLLPILSPHQSDSAARLAQVDRLLRLSGFVTLPACGVLALAVGPLTALVLGPAWQAVGLAAEPLILLTAFLSLMFPASVALAVVGQARFSLYAHLASLAIMVVLALLFRPETPWHAALVWFWAQVIVSPYSLLANGRALDVGLFRPLRAGVPMLTAVAVGVALALTFRFEAPLSALVCRGLVFVAVVAGGAAILGASGDGAEDGGLRRLARAGEARVACWSLTAEGCDGR